MINYMLRNQQRASVLHLDLRRLIAGMHDAGLEFDITTTHRGAMDQEAAHGSGHSNAHFGQSPHNYIPALAFDAYPVINGTVDVNDAAALDSFAVEVKAVAAKMAIAIVWGGDWHSIIDRPHFELANWKALRGRPQ